MKKLFIIFIALIAREIHLLSFPKKVFGLVPHLRYTVGIQKFPYILVIGCTCGIVWFDDRNIE